MAGLRSQVSCFQERSPEGSRRCCPCCFSFPWREPSAVKLDTGLLWANPDRGGCEGGDFSCRTWPASPSQCPWSAVGWQIDKNPTKPTSAWSLARGASGNRQNCLSFHTLQYPAAWALRSAHIRGSRTRALWLPCLLTKHQACPTCFW